MRAGGALALIFVACAAPPGARDSTSSGARVVSEADLPPPERDVLRAWRAGGSEWEARRASVALDERLARFLVDNLVRDMVRAYDRSALAQDAQPDGPFERARAELVLLGDRSAPLLARMLDLKDGVLAFLAADVLAQIGERALDPVAEELRAEREETRRRAAELLGRLPRSAEREIEIEKALAGLAERDEAWIVRAEACRALGARGARHDHKGYALGVLLRALRDPDDGVATSAAEGVLILSEVRAIPGLARALERAAQDGRVGVVRAIEAALKALSGASRSGSGAAWLAWWARHEARLTAPRADEREARH